MVSSACALTTSSTFGTRGTSTTSSAPSGDGERRIVTVPNVVLMSRADAEATLRRAGFAHPPSVDTSLCGSTLEHTTIVELGQVCSQAPAAGQQTSTTISVSIRVQTEDPRRGDLGNGRFWFLMPNLVGTDLDAARAKLRALGFISKDVQISYVEDGSCKANIVCRTYPEQMTRTDNTSDKVFYVARPLAPATIPGQPPTNPGQPAAKPGQPPPPPSPAKPDIF